MLDLSLSRNKLVFTIVSGSVATLAMTHAGHEYDQVTTIGPSRCFLSRKICCPLVFELAADKKV
jgi:hypothetical protein